MDVALYVNENLMIGNMATLYNVIEVLKNKGLVLNIVKGLRDYLSSKIKFFEDKKRAWLGQPYQIKNMEKSYRMFGITSLPGLLRYESCGLQ